MKIPESAEQALRLLVDPDTLTLAKPPVVQDDPIRWTKPDAYAERLKQVRFKTGLHCAIAWGRAQIDRHSVIVAASDLRFMMGSIGLAEAAALSDCFHAGARERRPVIWLARGSGGRIQEGTFFLAAMAKVLAARNVLAESNMPLISLMADPLAAGSTICATQGDVLIGLEGASMGFAGPKVVQQYDPNSPPENFQTAEYALSTGQIDAVVAAADLRSTLCHLASLLATPQGQGTASSDVAVAADEPDPWRLVERARSDDKLSTRDVLAQVFDAFFELRGDRVSGDDPAIVAGLARIAGRPVAVIGHDAMRTPEEKVRHNFAVPHPAGHRKALRVVRLAERLHLPIITLIDTPGACPDIRSESEGQAGIMGQLLCELLAAKVPTVSVILGQGNSGGAMVLATADRVLMTDSSYYTGVSPEAAAAILWKDPAMTAEAAVALHLTPSDMLRSGLADAIVPSGALPQGFGATLRCAIAVNLAGLAADRAKRIRLSD
jgi:acyl-CoA carboxylase subunit beta